MDYICYNSRKDYHKYPFGAVRNCEKLWFNVILPRSLMVSAVELIIHADGINELSVSLVWERMEGENEEWWGVPFTPEKAGLYFYHFEYTTAFGVSKILHNGDRLGLLNGGSDEWQLTVYDKAFTTPDWLKGGIIYQIFPDRFNSSGKKKNIPKGRRLHRSWDEEPDWKPDRDGEVFNNDFFGGDLEGIRQKLPYLGELGVTCIYLNPVFESNSNHRYDTADYEKIDPLLGSEEDLKKLCADAKKRGISIILDGVFSHTGDDSVYFNKFGHYDSVGAFQSKESPYYPWFKFRSFPDDYVCWWGFKNLPEVDEENERYREFITGKNGIIKKWQSLGVKGWRLDVADELPDSFLDALRSSIKKADSDAIIIGEVWEDASNKCAYDQRRRYFLGDQLDSVMNYPFAEAIIDFIRSGEVEGFSDKIESILENYPKCAIDVLMNHIGTHDTVRAITRLAGESEEYRDRQWQSEKELSEEEYEKGVALLKLASLIQYTLPGVPSLYYGDEAGMEGYRDPFNRKTYPWGKENKELIDWYKTIGKLRKSCSCFTDGCYYSVSETLSCLCFARKNEKDEALIIVNRNEHAIDYFIPSSWTGSETLLGKKDGIVVKIPALGAAVLKREF